MRTDFLLAWFDIWIMPRRAWADAKAAWYEIFRDYHEKKRQERIQQLNKDLDWDWNWRPCGALPYHLFDEGERHA